MARVLAKQCGYQPREINASDMRSASQLIDAITSAFTQNSHFNDNPQSLPICLIIDEVDGVVASSSAAQGQGGSSNGFGKVCEFLQKCIDSTAKK